LKKRELERLEEERILLERGAEAAHAFRLEKQGMAKADAEAIAAEQARLNNLKKRPDQLTSSESPDLQAFESRLLTRGPGADKDAIIAKNTEAMAAEQKKMSEQLRQIAQNTKPSTSTGGTPLRLVT